MDRSTRDLKRLVVRCDGQEVGKVDDLWFDDEKWMTRYLVLRTGTWLISRQIVIPPETVARVDWQARTVAISLNCEEIREAPTIESAKPSGKQGGANPFRSANDVIGCRVHARDGDVGYVEDLVISDRDWAVDALVVDTSKWPGGENLVVSPYRIARFGWDERKAYLDMDRDEILRSPEFHYSGSRR
ncbi:MAG: PRC-barrel domain containing protein [Acidobacteria bacterium]|nr:MAG: PRC-barrel domain containing protein [Acidobacteriota bacterium]